MSLKAKKRSFVAALKKNYRQQYGSIAPLPYMREQQVSVNQVFIDNGIKQRHQRKWEPLESYHDIFNCCNTNGSRLFIQGRPGYGKSTLCLQLAYDWCNRVKGSPMRDVDILIILRLRQFGKHTTLAQAIKLFLVPLSNVTADDIESILQECSSSTRIILDGYDEYVETEDNSTRPVDEVIMRKHLEKIDVTITTRYLPKELPTGPQLMRLTGFDNDGREAYVRKAIVDDDDEVRAITEQFQGNPAVTEFCSMPLIFVILAQELYERKCYLQDFSSITDVFRFLSPCFHDHLRTKLNHKNLKDLNRFENDHSALDKLAFEGLFQYGFSMAWTEKTVKKELSNDFYDFYVNLGILVTEKAIHDIDDDTDGTINDSNDSNDLINTTTTKVRFYHNIFSEWYASHHLALLASKPEITFTNCRREASENGASYNIGGIDPSQHQYVFRLACENRPENAEKIIKYLKDSGYERLAGLCTLDKQRKRKYDDVDDVEPRKHMKQTTSFCTIQ